MSAYQCPNLGNAHSSPGALVVGSSSSLEGNLFFFDPKPWLAVAMAIILISVLCWLPFVRNVTRSVSHITRATARIAEGQFDSQLPVTRGDELGQLSGSINHMASRLSGFVNGQKRFLRDAAHELCSPIARIQVGLGILEQSTGPDQQSCVADLREDVQHMSNLVNEVLSFSRAGIRPDETRIEPVDLAAMIARVVDREAVSGAQITHSVERQDAGYSPSRISCSVRCPTCFAMRSNMQEAPGRFRSPPRPGAGEVAIRDFGQWSRPCREGSRSRIRAVLSPGSGPRTRHWRGRTWAWPLSKPALSPAREGSRAVIERPQVSKSKFASSRRL